MARNYYTLVAGLREYALGPQPKGFDARAIIDEIAQQLSRRDSEYLTLFYYFYDIDNIVNLMAGRTQFSTLGNFTREQLEAEIKEPAELPTFIANILRAYKEPDNADYEEIDHTKALERALYEAYYKECEKSGCRFLRRWSEFDRNIRNLTAAFTARRLSRPMADVLVSEGFVVDMLGRSSAADFGLKGELEYIDHVIAAISEEGNLLDKENRIDRIRWEMAEGLTTFDYFNIDTILGYLVKVNIIHRWTTLDEKIGREMFRSLLESMSSETKLAQAEQQFE